MSNGFCCGACCARTIANGRKKSVATKSGNPLRMEIPPWNFAMGVMESDLRLNVQRICRFAEGGVLRAVAGTLHHPKVCGPRTHGFPVLVGHNPGNLVQMS